MQYKQPGYSVLFLSFSLAAIACPFLVGCAKEPPQGPRLYPVVGKLMIDGQPAVGATLKFMPMNANPVAAMKRTPAATVGANGLFKASFFKFEDGAPEGEYKLLVFWLEIPTEGGMPQDRLQGRFINENAPIKVITVKAVENDVGLIELSSR